VLKVEDIGVRYGSTQAVRSASFEVRAGEITALVGSNGAGKTTTLKAIVGLASLSKGTVFLDGKALRRPVPERLVRRGIVLVPEGRQIFVTMTVEENLRLAELAAPKGKAQEGRWTRDDVYERFASLARRRTTSAGALSGGEQQQLAIARALVANPRLILLDEPSFGLAPQLVDQLFVHLGELRDSGTAILLVEQNALRAIDLADRAYVMSQGTVRRHAGGDHDRVKEELINAYLGPAERQEADGV